MARKRVEDHGSLTMFRREVKTYNNLLDIEGSDDQVVFDCFYITLLDTIEQIKKYFTELTVSKEKAREKFDPDKIDKNFIKRLEAKANEETKVASAKADTMVPRFIVTK